MYITGPSCKNIIVFLKFEDIFLDVSQTHTIKVDFELRSKFVCTLYLEMHLCKPYEVTFLFHTKIKKQKN